MSDLNILQSLRQLLQTASITGLTNSDISYLDAPKIFDPEGKDLWIQEGFNPVFDGDYGVTLSTAIDEIKSVFFNGASSVYSTQKVDILDVVAQGISNNDAWKRRVITINYLTFSTR